VSDDIFKASGGKSKGNLRAMHGKVAAGRFDDIVFDDANKRIEGCAKVVDDDEWKKVEEGVYTGFSHGGSYAKRWKDESNPALTRYTPELAEVSLVDNPCVPTGHVRVRQGRRQHRAAEVQQQRGHHDQGNPKSSRRE